LKIRSSIKATIHSHLDTFEGLNKRSDDVSAGSVLVESFCLLEDFRNCNEEEKRCKELARDSIRPSSGFGFHMKSNWHYTFKFESINDQSSQQLEINVNTEPKCYIPDLKGNLESKSLTVWIPPHCQLDGPQKYQIFLYKGKNEIFGFVNPSSNTYTYYDLIPAQQYKVYVKSNLKDCQRIFNYETVQIRPEGVPTIFVSSQSEDSLGIVINKPDKTYELEGEVLKYNIVVDSSPLKTDENCL